MFLVDDVVKEFISYVKEKLLKKSERHIEALSHARKAMRKLASSLSETVAFLERGIHQLERVVDDPDRFYNSLSNLVDSETLYRNSHESGVCADLRIAQDELNRFESTSSTSDQHDIVYRLTRELDGYERRFVESVREFLLKSQALDLSFSRKHIQADPRLSLKALRERVSALKNIEYEIDVLLDELREKDLIIGESRIRNGG
jgi:hypothetical protein